jgi:hypothetical protein
MVVKSLARKAQKWKKTWRESRFLVDLYEACDYLSLAVIFLAYPTVCRNCLTTFACPEVANNTAFSAAAAGGAPQSGQQQQGQQGQQGQLLTSLFLAADPSVQCADDSTTYLWMKNYSIAMFLLVAFGLPSIAVISLLPFRFPVNRLFTSMEDGRMAVNRNLVGGR